MENSIQIKVCGLTKLDQIDELIDLKIDFLGFIFYSKSPRYVLDHLSLDDISKINHNKKVGIFVNESVEQIVDIAQKAKLQLIQLHGDESVEFIKNLRLQLNNEIKIIKVFRISELTQFNNALFQIKNSLKNEVDYYLYDTDSKAFGGTGKTFDWTILNQISIEKPYFLSGGISLENIEDLKIIKEKPFALDINSKFEIEPGNKNIELIKKFKNSI